MTPHRTGYPNVHHTYRLVGSLSATLLPKVTATSNSPAHLPRSFADLAPRVKHKFPVAGWPSEVRRMVTFLPHAELKPDL